MRSVEGNRLDEAAKRAIRDAAAGCGVQVRGADAGPTEWAW